MMVKKTKKVNVLKTNKPTRRSSVEEGLSLPLDYVLDPKRPETVPDTASVEGQTFMFWIKKWISDFGHYLSGFRIVRGLLKVVWEKKYWDIILKDEAYIFERLKQKEFFVGGDKNNSPKKITYSLVNGKIIEKIQEVKSINS